MSIVVDDKTLAAVELFSGIQGPDLQHLLPACEEIRRDAGEPILVAGQAERALYVLLEGTAEVDVDPPRAMERMVAELAAGSVFGESSFFHASAHSANVKARTAVRLLRLDRQAFDKLLEEGNPAALRIAANAAVILATRLQAADRLIVDLLERIHDEKIRRAVADFRTSMSHSFSSTVRPSIQIGSMQ